MTNVGSRELTFFMKSTTIIFAKSGTGRRQKIDFPGNDDFQSSMTSDGS